MALYSVIDDETVCTTKNLSVYMRWETLFKVNKISTAKQLLKIQDNVNYIYIYIYIYWEG